MDCQAVRFSAVCPALLANRAPYPRRCSFTSRLRSPSAFTLMEVIIASTLSVFVLAGVLSAFLMIGRTGFRTSSYSELAAQANRGLEIFAEDARGACNIHWNSSQSITFTEPTATNATTLVTYAYDNDPASATYGCFYRLDGDTGFSGPRQVLIRGVAGDFAFQRYKLDQTGTTDDTAGNDLETKQVALTLHAFRSGPTTVAANQAAISSRYILRNKRVTN
ncbi:MAG: hypothetical protein KGJ37_04085 [Verrucomicrobiota bacterium]|nr:hypothetical protein [Verrucomicrobiota bacterium]